MKRLGLWMKIQWTDRPPELHHIASEITFTAMQRYLDESIEFRRPIRVLLFNGDVLNGFCPWEAERIQLLVMPTRRTG